MINNIRKHGKDHVACRSRSETFQCHTDCYRNNLSVTHNRDHTTDSSQQHTSRSNNPK